MPERTLELLNALESLGFGNKEFRQIHHSREAARIGVHRGHCVRTHKFSARTNVVLRERLEIIKRKVDRGETFEAAIAASLTRYPLPPR